jgi:hypothetical protein
VGERFGNVKDARISSDACIEKDVVGKDDSRSPFIFCRPRAGGDPSESR